MGEKILVDELIAAGEDFVRDFNDSYPISVACWVIPADSTELEDLVLYIASDEIDDNNFDVAYREVLRKLSGKKSQWLDPFQIKLVNTSDPIARDAIQIRDRYPAPSPTRYGGSAIGGTSIDGAYIYQPILAMKAMP